MRQGLHFGTFAVIPDHVELGSQTAEIIYDIMDNEWHVQRTEVEQPRSVYKILNLDQAQQLFHVRKEQLNIIDKLLR